MGRILYTWRDETFDPTSGTIDRTRSPYRDSVPALDECYAAVAARIGTRDFLWCFAEADQHRYFETHKNVELIILVGNLDILGYVDSGAWEALLHEDRSRDDWFHMSCADLNDYSVIVRFPLSPQQLVEKRIYDIKSPTQATVRERIRFRHPESGELCPPS